MSSLPYVQQLSKVIVAQITQTIGWNSIQTTPLELLTDILHKYLEELTRQTQRYAELCKWRFFVCRRKQSGPHAIGAIQAINYFFDDFVCV